MRIYLGHKMFLGLNQKLFSVIYCIFSRNSELLCHKQISYIVCFIFSICYSFSFFPTQIINYFSFARLLIMAASTTSRRNTVDLITYLGMFLCFKIMAAIVQIFFYAWKFLFFHYILKLYFTHLSSVTNYFKM